VVEVVLLEGYYLQPHLLKLPQYGMETSSYFYFPGVVAIAFVSFGVTILEVQVNSKVAYWLPLQQM
jgi:hypothetical protein